MNINSYACTISTQHVPCGTQQHRPFDTLDTQRQTNLEFEERAAGNSQQTLKDGIEIGVATANAETKVSSTVQSPYSHRLTYDQTVLGNYATSTTHSNNLNHLFRSTFRATSSSHRPADSEQPEHLIHVQAIENSGTTTLGGSPPSLLRNHPRPRSGSLLRRNAYR